MANDQFNLYNSNNGNVNPASNNETSVAKLALLGGLLSTLGDAISTMAAVFALEELQQTQNNNNNDKISELEKQVKYLTKEINQQKIRGDRR
jgi:hypothetical protein